MTVVSDACRKDTQKLTVIPISYVGIANPPSTILSPALNTTSPTILITTTKTTLSTINTILMCQSLEKMDAPHKSYSTPMQEIERYQKNGEKKNSKMGNLDTTQKKKHKRKKSTEWLWTWRKDTWDIKCLRSKTRDGDKFWSWRNIRKTCIFQSHIFSLPWSHVRTRWNMSCGLLEDNVFS